MRRNMFGNWTKLFQKIQVFMDDIVTIKHRIFEIDEEMRNLVNHQNKEIEALRAELRRRTDYYETLLMAVIEKQIKPVETPKNSALQHYLEKKKVSGGLPLPG